MAFSEDEIILCTYAVLYGSRDIGGIESIQVANRSVASIQMKIQNIAAMLDERGIRRFSHVSPLSGLPAGQRGRLTNWKVVEPLTRLSRAQLLERCQAILTNSEASRDR